MSTAAKSIERKGSSKTKSFRKTVAQAGVSVVIPDKVNSLKVQNVGTVDIRLRFNNTGTDYWTLKVDAIEEFNLGDNVAMDAAGVGADGIMECVFS